MVVILMKENEIKYKIEKKGPMVVKESSITNYNYQMPVHAPSEGEVAQSKIFLSDRLVGIIATDINEDDARIERLRRQ